MLAEQYTFNYVWTLWDLLFGTQVVPLLATLGIECPTEPPTAWNDLFKAPWDHALTLRRKQTFLSRLSLGHSGGTPVYYQLATLTMREELASDPRPTQDEVSYLAEEVTKQLKQSIKVYEQASSESVCAFLESVAKWAMSRVAFHPDIPHLSLYDIAATAGAIHTCTDRTDQPEKPFILSSIDLSGIQRYIFAIQYSATTGVAKRLRSRSFFLSLFLDSIIVEILARLGLSTLQVISRSGGQAQLLLPNTEKTIAVLNDLQEELDAYAIKHFEGLLTVHVSATSFSTEEMREQYAQVLRRNAEQLRRRKQRALDRILFGSEGWNEDSFIVGDLHPKARCSSCRRLGTFDEVCTDCARDRHLGGLIPKQDRFYLTDARGVDGIELFGRWIMTVVPPNTDSHSICLSFQAVPEPEAGSRIWWSERARHVAQYPSGDTMEFTEIAATSRGKKRLAYVKADIDRLGMLFAFGIPHSETVLHPCQVRGLSGEIDSFTSGYLQRLLISEYPDTYTVFAGGDDIAVITPWNQGIEIATKLRRQLARLSGDNPDVTLSAAVRVVEPLLPVTFAMEMVEEDLEQAKETVGLTGDRDQVTIFGRTMAWRDAFLVLEDGNFLCESLEKKYLSGAMLHQLQALGLLFREYMDKKSVSGLRYRPLLHYLLARWDEDRDLEKAFKKEPKLREWLYSLAGDTNGSIGALLESVRFALMSRFTEEDAD